MTIPSLPSDSLYKFISFFGMSLSLLCYYFLFTEERYLDQKVLSLNAKNEEIRMQDSLLWRDAKEIQAEAEYISRRNGVKNPFIATDTSYSWTMTYKGLKAEEAVSDTIKKLINQFKANLRLSAQKKIESDINEYLIDEIRKDYNKNNIIFGVLSLLGAVICGIGFCFWYYFIQKPNDKKTQRELLSIPVIAAYCQSCNVNFEHYDNKRGAEADGKINNYFCKACYDNGQFTQPNMTLADMEAAMADTLKSLGYKQKEIKSKISDLKDLQRWNTKARY